MLASVRNAIREVSGLLSDETITAALRGDAMAIARCLRVYADSSERLEARDAHEAEYGPEHGRDRADTGA